MKKLLLFLSALVLITSSCSKERMALGKAASINITDARYIFKTGPSTKSLSADEEGYWKMTAKGAVEALNFQDEKGNPLEITISDIWEIGKSYLGVKINMGNKYLIDKRTGKLYVFPENAQFYHNDFYDQIGKPGHYDQKEIAREVNGKLYIMGELRLEDNIPQVEYFIEVDVKYQTSTRCTPDGLSANEIVVSKDGLIAFGSGDIWYLMTPEKSLKKYDGYNSHCFFVDKEDTLYMIKQVVDSEGVFVKQAIYRICLQGGEIAEDFVCDVEPFYPIEGGDFHLVHYFDLNQFSVIFPINKVNGNVLMFGRRCDFFAEFDGNEITYFDMDEDIVDNSMFDYNYFGLMHQYRYEIPENNVYFASSDDNAVTLSHLDLRTHRWEKKTLTLFSPSEYSLAGFDRPSVYQQHIFYSCVRHSDSHIVSFMMDFDGNRTEVSDNSSSFSVSNFLMIN